MKRARRVGVFGGTFDPIHLGHLAAVEDAAYALSLDRVVFVPNRQPPHKTGQRVSSVEDRVAMVRLCVADNPLFEMSTVELDRPGPSYTLDTLRELRDTCPAGTQLCFLVGCDAIPALHTWHQPDALLQEFGLVVMERPTGSAVDWAAAETRFPHIRRQVEIIQIVQLEISSSDIRRRVETGRPIRYYVPPPVERYIRQHRLYDPAAVTS